jgi:hypothetical protein
MTVAICLRCGARKHGAWTRCPDCGFLPEDDEDLARSILVSDHVLDGTGLDDVSRRIQEGQPVGFDPDEVDAIVAEVRVNPDYLTMPLGLRIVIWIPIVILLLLIGLFVWTRTWMR